MDYVGLSGVVVDETRNTSFFDVKANESIVKDSSVFNFQFSMEQSLKLTADFGR